MDFSPSHLLVNIEKLHLLLRNCNISCAILNVGLVTKDKKKNNVEICFMRMFSCQIIFEILEVYLLKIIYLPTYLLVFNLVDLSWNSTFDSCTKFVWSRFFCLKKKPNFVLNSSILTRTKHVKHTKHVE